MNEKSEIKSLEDFVNEEMEEYIEKMYKTYHAPFLSDDEKYEYCCKISLDFTKKLRKFHSEINPNANPDYDYTKLFNNGEGLIDEHLKCVHTNLNICMNLQLKNNNNK